MIDPARPDLQLPMLALSDPYHDSVYVVVDENGVRNVELERLTRFKYEELNPLIAAWIFDREAVERARTFLFVEGDSFGPLLRRMQSGAPLYWRGEVTELVRRQHGSMPAEPLLSTPGLVDGLVRVFERLQAGEARWQIMDHHFCHAANAFLSSPFERALTFTLDGGGAHFIDGKKVHVHGSVYKFDRKERLSRAPLHLVTDWSPGWAWTRVPGAIGYQWSEAGTVMAMAAYGKPTGELRRAAARNPVWAIDQSEVSIARRTAIKMADRGLRKVISEDASRFGLAAALQDETERRIRDFMAPFLDNAGEVDVCLSGGVFLNCIAAGKVAIWFPNVKRIFIPPAPYDGGLALGLAQAALADQGIDPYADGGERFPFASTQTYGILPILAACRSAALPAPAPAKPDEIAARIGSGEIVAIFQGGSEAGRRALGNRSILADPRDPAKKDVLNRVVKKRQWFRPFAPMILHEEVANWFDVWEGFESPYMSFAVNFLPGKGEQVPAVRHEDGSARVQTVHRDLTPRTHELLKAWQRHSGVPILLNTSFNDSEPIVETPQEAVATMLRSGIDGIWFADFDLFAGNPNSAAGRAR